MLWSCCVVGEGLPWCCSLCCAGDLLSPHQHLPEGSGFGSVIPQYQLSSGWWHQSWPWRQMCFTHSSTSWRGNQAGYWKLNKQSFKSFFFFFPCFSPFPHRGWEGDVFSFLKSQECFCHLMRQMTAQKFISLLCQSILVVFFINK